MKSFILINSGFEELALKEISELIKVKGKIAGKGVIEFETKKREDLVLLSYYSQSFRKVLVGLDKVSNLNKINFSQVNWKDYFSTY